MKRTTVFMLPDEWAAFDKLARAQGTTGSQLLRQYVSNVVTAVPSAKAT